MSEENYQNIIQKTFQDPLTDLLLKNSQLTRVQFETLVIDMLTDIISDNSVSIQQKTLLRRNNISRGSFSRSLSQARSNVISSIFTIILLSYIGVFEERPFDEYYVLTQKLREYSTLSVQGEYNIDKTTLKRIESELINGISQLTKPTSIKFL